MNRRAQMEILGLAIIVVLVMMGVLFAIQFVLRAPSQEIAQEYERSELASSLLTTILGTTTECRQASVTELLQDCARFTRISCPPRGNSCAELDFVIEKMLDGTLETWRQDYNFSISGSTNTNAIKFERGNCTGEIESSTNPIPTAGRALQIRLDLCS